MVGTDRMRLSNDSYQCLLSHDELYSVEVGVAGGDSSREQTP